MSEPYLGQIEAFPYNFVPKGWAACQGQLMAIQANTALFSVLGTTYGGDGIRTFALPDLRGRVAMGQGNGAGLTPRVIGEQLGETTHTILLSEMPAHSHTLNTAPSATGNIDTPGPTVVLANATGKQGGDTITVTPYAAVPPVPSVAMAPTAIAMSTGGQPHENMMPYLALQFCIAITGIYPTRG
jgi:microcystin-dependent protein